MKKEWKCIHCGHVVKAAAVYIRILEDMNCCPKCGKSQVRIAAGGK